MLCNLQSAIAGLNSPKRTGRGVVCPEKAVLKVGPFAIEPREPCQVRKEAAVSESLYVPEDHLTGAADSGNARAGSFNAGCAFLMKIRLRQSFQYYLLFEIASAFSDYQNSAAF